MFNPKEREKDTMVYKTLYINSSTLKKVDEFAQENNLSLNAMITQMIEYCLSELEGKNNK